MGQDNEDEGRAAGRSDNTQRRGEREEVKEKEAEEMKKKEFGTERVKEKENVVMGGSLKRKADSQ